MPKPPPTTPISPTLHLPPKPAGELQRFTAYLALALESRLDAMPIAPTMTPSETLALVLNALDEARKEMGWSP